MEVTSETERLHLLKVVGVETHVIYRQKKKSKPMKIRKVFMMGRMKIMKTLPQQRASNKILTYGIAKPE